MPMFKTSLKMFNESKFFGMGPKSYRYYCNDDKFITYFSKKPKIVDNTVLKFNNSWKEKRKYFDKRFFRFGGDTIQKGDTIFSYKFRGFDEGDLNYYISDKEGVVEKNKKRHKYKTRYHFT